MMTLILGGSGSGKSAYAESYCLSCTGTDAGKYYIATMQIWDDEMQKKVDRHHKMRAGKGFVTIERPRAVEEAAAQIAGQQKPGQPCVALLECLSNLTANEMFVGEIPEEREAVIRRVLAGIGELARQTEQLVIVTNNVFEDGICYDAATMEYIEALGRINEALAQRADAVIEVVAGIPVWLKGEKRCGY